MGKRVSCADAIFAIQEVINRYLQEGSKVYMCLYDLQKAFDLVVSCAFEETVWHGSKFQDMAHIAQLVYRLSELHMPETTCLPLLSSWTWDEARFHSFTSPVPACHGPSPKTTSVPVSWYLSKQHICWRVLICWHSHTCLQSYYSGSPGLPGDTVHQG